MDDGEDLSFAESVGETPCLPGDWPTLGLLFYKSVLDTKPQLRGLCRVRVGGKHLHRRTPRPLAWAFSRFVSASPSWFGIGSGSDRPPRAGRTSCQPADACIRHAPTGPRTQVHFLDRVEYGSSRTSPTAIQQVSADQMAVCNSAGFGAECCKDPNQAFNLPCRNVREQSYQSLC